MDTVNSNPFVPVDAPVGSPNETGNTTKPSDTSTNQSATENADCMDINQLHEWIDSCFPSNNTATETNSQSVPENANNTDKFYSVVIDSTALTSELAIQRPVDPQNTAATVSIHVNEPFKQPLPPRSIKRPITINNAHHYLSSDKTSESEGIDSESYKRRKVDIYTHSEGPKWYDINDNVLNISRTIVPSLLPEAFKFMPIFGRPDSKSELNTFYTNKVKDFIASGIDDEEYSNLKQMVSSNMDKISKKFIKLQSSIPGAGILNDMLIYKPELITSADSDLCIVKKFRLRKEKDVNNIFTKKLKYRGIRLMPLQEDDSTPVGGPLLEPGKDIIYRIRIYRPFPYNKQKAYRGRHSVFSRDLILVGRQKLTDLRDSFVCSNDIDMRVDMSQNIADVQVTNAKDLFPSGFLFINNVFYVDSRAGCKDTSARIREWAAHKRGLGRFPVRDMAAVRLDELNIRLGHPEVYVHQGNCEHLFTFSEVRVALAGDPAALAHFPRHSAVSQNQTVYCTTCAEFGAKFVVTGCDRVPFDPAFFCDTCLKLYLYANGTKICDFKAYPYRGNEMHSSKPQG